MWIMLNDAFFSIVKKDCTEDQLLVRARRAGDIEKVFGRRHKVDRVTVSDYLYRAVVPFDDVAKVMVEELRRVTYNNFKDSVHAHDLHTAYMRVWSAMAAIQNPRPYSEPRYTDLQRTFFPEPPPPLGSEDFPGFDADPRDPLPPEERVWGKVAKVAKPRKPGKRK
jgi:hypothetical protein